MPSRIDPRQAPPAENDERKLAELEALVIQIKTDNESLKIDLERAQAENESLSFRLQQQEVDVDEEEDERDSQQSAPAKERPEIVLITLIFVIAVRTFLFLTIEDCGKTALIEALLANTAVIFSGMWLLGSWGRLEWKTHRWEIVPRAAFLIIGGMASLSAIAGADVWNGVYSPPDGISAVIAAVFMTVALLIAASDIPASLVKAIQNLIAWFREDK